MTNKQITINYSAFRNTEFCDEVASFSFEWRHSGSDEDLLNELFHATNTYGGALWEAIKDKLPINRTHTALCVGDTIWVGDHLYSCEPVGWKLLAGSNASLI